jgi:hypothetical protein
MILAGCAPKLPKPLLICPGRQSASSSLYLLQVYANDTKNLNASGQCLAEFTIDGKPHRENFPVKIWYNVPSRIRIHGDIAFNPRGLDVGSNKDEFWMAMKPKEAGNSYFWGKWTENADFGGLKFGPKVFIESLGLIEVNQSDNWVLSNSKGTDILSKYDDNGRIIKKIYIYNCDYRVRKIEYFGDNEKVVVAVELDDYKDIYNGVLVPQKIHIFNFNNNGTRDSFRIKLSSVKAMTEFYLGKQQKVLFSRPEPRGFERIYRIVDGDVIEQPQ